MICKIGLVLQILIGPLNQWCAVGGVCAVKTCKGSNTESDCVTWCVKSSWLRQRKRRLRLELRVAPQIAQVTNSDLIPACLGEKEEEEEWRRQRRKRRRRWEGWDRGKRQRRKWDRSEGQWGRRWTERSVRILHNQQSITHTCMT